MTAFQIDAFQTDPLAFQIDTGLLVDGIFDGMMSGGAVMPGVVSGGSHLRGTVEGGSVMPGLTEGGRV